MRTEEHRSCNGQGLVEYALIISLVVIVVVLSLFLLGPQVGNVFSTVIGSSTPVDSPSPQPTPVNVLAMADDFKQRIFEFYLDNGRWPRSWGDYAFTDIGLDPADWGQPVGGIYWNPNGDCVGLANRAGDDIQLYVNDLNGNELHLYDGWNIWCLAGSSNCYYHTIAPGNEVDINTLSVRWE